MAAFAQSLGIDLSDRQTRGLLACIGASLLLHASVLFLIPSLREGKPAAAPPKMLIARIAPRTATTGPLPEARPEPRPVPPPPKVEAPRPVLTAPGSTPAPALPRVAEPPPVPTPAPAAAAPAPPPAAPAAPAPPAVATTAPRASEAQAPAVQNEGVDPGTLDRFRMDIMDATRRYRRYPAQAMEKGWQGKVEIRLVIGANGLTQSFAIKTSSGFQLLDETALDMVKKGRPLAQVPPSLRGREFFVDVPIIFDLRSG